MRDLQAISDVITLGIKAAMAPVLERLAVAEAKAARVTETEQALQQLRDRVTAWEAKSDVPLPVPVVAEPVDLTPLRERIAGLEAQAVRVPVIELSLAEMRDKLVALETKAQHVIPVHETIEVPDLTPLEKRLDVLEGKPVEVELAIKEDCADLRRRILALATHVDPVAHEKEISALRERLAVVETRAPIPGPPGKDGANGHDGKDGKDGLNGKDGADGFAFDDLTVAQKDSRSFTVQAVKGDRIRDIGTVRFPVMEHKGIYQAGKLYEPGDVVTFDNSQWHCNETTSEAKPGQSKAWSLIVRKGRDGRDGKDAPSLPVVALK